MTLGFNWLTALYMCFLTGLVYSHGGVTSLFSPVCVHMDVQPWGPALFTHHKGGTER